jgi:hypothetical protein
VSWLVGVQAQDAVWARWSVGLRMARATEAAVERALASGAIVRTWAMRGTLHLVAARDVHWLLALEAPRVIAGNARRYAQLGLDEATLRRGVEVIGGALAGGGALTRAELGAGLEAAGISAEGQRAPYLLQRAALDRVIRFGPDRKPGTPTYTLLGEAPAGAAPAGAAEPDASELARRYLAGHAPATPADFAWWSGLSAGHARPVFEQPPAAPAAELPRSAHLLPPFDEYLLGYRDRGAALPPEHMKRVNAGGGMPRPTIVLDGKVVGTFRRTFSRRGLAIAAEPFRPLDRDEQALVAAAADHLGQFVGQPATLSVVESC